MLHNTGQSLVFRVDKDTKQHVNISGGISHSHTHTNIFFYIFNKSFI